jgi:methylthioribose-1-phosphate isomerase
VELRTVGEVVEAMRAGVIDGGLALSQAALQALALAAMSAGDASRPATLATLRGAARALSGARPDVPLVRAVVETVLEDAGAGGDEPLVPRLCRSADGLTRTIHAEHVQVACRGAAWLGRSFGGTVRVLVTGVFGAHATGSIGTTSAILRAAADRGTSLDVWVPAGMPAGRSEAILSAALADTPATVRAVSDVRIGALLLERRVQVVLLGASWLAADGSLAGEVGSRTIAVLAKEAGIPVVGVASAAMNAGPRPHEGPPAPADRAGGPVPLELVDARWLGGILGETGLRRATVAGGLD